MSGNEHLRRSQDLLERLFRSSPAAIALVRLGDGVVLDVNESYQRLFGWRRDEAIGRSAEALRVWVHPEERARFRELLATKGRIVDFESKARRKDGEEFDSLLSAEIIEDAGQCIALIIVNDVSARRRADDARALLGAVVETSSDAIIVSDPETRIVSWNTGAERMFGWSAAEAVGRELSLIVPPERWQETLGNTGRMRSGEAVPTFETVRVAKGGRLLDVQVSVSGVYEGDRLRLVAGIFRDITERRRAEAALRASEERFARMFRKAPEFMALVRAADAKIVDVNEVFERVTGYARAEIIGRTSAEAGLWADLEHRQRVFEALRARGTVHDVEFQLRRRDGTMLHALLDGVTLDLEEPCWLLVTRDITERKRAEDALRESEQRLEKRVVERTEALDAANRELEAFSYTVSHDLRAPLRAIDGFAELIEQRSAVALDPESREYLGHVRDAVARMDRLIEDLLAFSQAARAEVTKRAVDLSALARTVAAELAGGDPERRVSWRIADGLRVHADPGLTRVVLENLLGNAWKYTGKKVEARIEVGQEGSGEIFVRDNGIGFDPAHADTLFQPFRRLQGAQAFEGTGVGLATVQRIVVRHGGRVRAEGVPGEGAVFRFFLPHGDALPG